MDYARYQVEDFLMDPAFVRWVRSPDPATEAFWDEFLQQHPQQRPTVQAARALLQAVRFDDEPVSTATVLNEWERFRQTQAREKTDERNGRVVRLPARKKIWWAAATVAGLLFGLFWWQNRSPDDVLYQTAYGGQRTVRLPDGSSVMLNANSELRVPGDWTRRSVREVWLKGEGFFRVTKRPGQSQPQFVVHTGELDVRVLGTSFNVRSRRRESDVQLQSGLVQLEVAGRDSTHALRLYPGDGVRVRPKTAPERRRVNPESMAAWTTGILILNRMTLREVGQVIEDTYGRRVVIRSSSLSNRMLNGSLPTRDERAFLEGVAASLDVPVRIDNTVVVFGN